MESQNSLGWKTADSTPSSPGPAPNRPIRAELPRERPTGARLHPRRPSFGLQQRLGCWGAGTAEPRKNGPATVSHRCLRGPEPGPCSGHQQSPAAVLRPSGPVKTGHTGHRAGVPLAALLLPGPAWSGDSHARSSLLQRTPSQQPRRAPAPRATRKSHTYQAQREPLLVLKSWLQPCNNTAAHEGSGPRTQPHSNQPAPVSGQAKLR